MFRDEIIKYKVSECITLKVIKTKIFGITIASTCYLSDEGKYTKSFLMNSILKREYISEALLLWNLDF